MLRTGESSPDPNIPLKEMNPSIQNFQQLETPLRELLERQTREAEIASDAMKRADEGDETGDSRSWTWKPSTVIGKSPAKRQDPREGTSEVYVDDVKAKESFIPNLKRCQAIISMKKSESLQEMQSLKRTADSTLKIPSKTLR
ncbi:hypothetical protein PIB30_046776 [Stylosanthes scabra]|uniref:Uncharacterized protein n=1 Tax=Stylosanthes scabra TaxID=79078 RepID=A0ABU6XEL9_9FABA|nr:hypothetical protein [Stylosanthes scabra]